MTHFSLRSATTADLDAIMDMEAAGFASGDRESRELYAERIECFADGALMATRGEGVVGCLFAEIWSDAQLAAEHFVLGHDIRSRHAPQGSVLYVASMTIAPVFRGLGFGAQLFEGGIAHIEAAHPQLCSVLLLVNETWVSARAIYSAAGFAERARLPGFFRPDARSRQDGIVMSRAR